MEMTHPARFLETVEPTLASREVLHTALLSAARTLAGSPGCAGVQCWLATRAGRFAGAAILGPKGALEFAGEAADAEAWTGALGAGVVRWVGGEREAVEALLLALGGRWTPPLVTDVMATRVAPPVPRGANGALGPATSADCALVTSWVDAFLAETGLPPVAGLDRAVAAMIVRGDIHLWRVDGAPASMIAVVGRTRHTVRFSLVYTPPTLRRRGYARACTGAATGMLLAQGWAECCVHVRSADVAAKALYSGLGFHHAGTRAEASREGLCD